MNRAKLQGWTLWRLARESGVSSETIFAWASGRLINPWSEHRLRQTLNWLGMAGTRSGQ